MLNFYAGIGSRRTPLEVCQFFTVLAAWLESRGLILRSGGADGADTAFQDGVTDQDCRRIYRPRIATPEAISMAKSFHPAWEACTEFAKRLHGRNSMIILGQDLKTPAKFVVCWTANENRGGTSLGLRIARANDIPVFNVHKEKKLEYLYEKLGVLLAA